MHDGGGTGGLRSAAVAAITTVLLLLADTPLRASAAERPVAPAQDHDWARDAVRAGRIRPLTEILRRVESEFDGQVLEVELERDDDTIVYEIEFLTPRGHVIELHYDARSGTLIATEGRGVEQARRAAARPRPAAR
jgi:hypothetical protein